MATQRIIICNAKGGCGKTTIATNIASYFASIHKLVRLFDYDNQSSASHWVRRRSEQYAPIDVVDASRSPANGMTRSWQMRVPPETDVVIIDTPAAMDILELEALLQPSDSLIIPVLPSPIDIQATAYFIKDLLLVGKARQKKIRIAVVANRVRKNTLIYHSLERFLFTLNLPFVTSLRDTQFYIKAIEQGIGVMDLKQSKAKIDREQWAPLIRWLNAPSRAVGADIRPFINNKVSA